MKIILTNGKELNPIMVTGSTKYVQGENRDTLSFIFSATADMAELDADFSAENCESITIIGDDDDSESIHNGYTIRFELTKANVKVSDATDVEDAVYENRITVSMAQRTYIESQLAATQAAVEMLCMPDVE